MQPVQSAIPVEVSLPEIARKPTLGAAITLCMDLCDVPAKRLQSDLGLDKAQVSRWESGGEGVQWPKFDALMNYCGNDAPLLWMAHARGYDMASLRRRESELERQLREAREENLALRRVLVGAGR